MQSLDFNEQYRITLSEMSRKSELAVSTWFNDWFSGGGERLKKLQSVTVISTQIILHSRIALYRNNEKLPDGSYELEDGTVFTVPLTEDCLNDLPASLVGWLIDAAGKENPHTLEGFLAATRTAAARGQKLYARLSGSGQLGRSTPH